MLFVLLLWLFASVATLGIGFLGTEYLRLIFAKCFSRSVPSLSDIFAVGFVLIYAGTLCWSLLFPVNGQFVFLIGVLSFLGFACKGSLRRLPRSYQRAFSRDFFFFLLLAFPVLLVVAHLASAPVLIYDTYLYHLNAVWWNSEFGTVKGLANLHSRFGFNSSFLNFAALFDVGIFRGLASHFALSFLGVFTILRSLDLCFKERRNTIGILALALFSVSWTMTLSQEISSLSTDNALSYFCVLTVLELLRLPYLNFSFKDPVKTIRTLLEKGGWTAFLFTSFASITFTIKSSGSAFLLGALAFFLFMAISFFKLRSISKSVRSDFLKVFGIISGTCFVILSAQILRNVLISGWIIYPIFRFPWNLEWAVSLGKGAYEMAVVQAWGRIGSTQLDLKFADWIGIWWEQRFSFQNKFYLFGGILLSLLSLGKICVLSLRKKLEGLSLRVLIFYPMLTVCFLSWFFSAPNQRFLILVFPIFFYLALVDFVFLYFKSVRVREFLILIPVLCLHILNPQTLKWDTDRGLWELGGTNLPKFQSFPIQTSSKSITDFYVPSGSDQCGNLPLPCSTFASDDLRLYDPTDIAKGIYRVRCNEDDFEDCPHVDRLR